jgi:hypothetical protein
MAVPKLEDIELGARVCRLIKALYYAEKEWVDCYHPISDLFTTVKFSARKMYHDKTEAQMLDVLGKYDKFDMDLLIGV